jgi:hypothetical protein
MDSGDGGWIRAEATQPDEDEEYEVRSAGGEGPGRGPGLDGDDGWPSARHLPGPSTGPSTGSLTGKRWGHGGVPGFSAWVAAAVAVVAAAAGVAAALFVIRGTPSATAVTGSALSASASARPAQLQIALTGRVLAVSRTSITIGGAGPSVTAAVTGATTITGRAHSIGGVKAGDEVSAQLTGTAARLTATAIQDLASA